jgi:hypothetical protein
LRDRRIRRRTGGGRIASADGSGTTTQGGGCSILGAGANGKAGDLGPDSGLGFESIDVAEATDISLKIFGT